MIRQMIEAPRFSVPWFLTRAAALGATVVLAAGCGNEHGSSETNIDTMPSYAVGPMESVPTPSGNPLPKQAKTASMWVCNSIFIDRSAGEVIIRPVVEGPKGERPMHLLGLNGEGGANFTTPQPRDNFEVKNLDGTPDSDQILNGCQPENVTARNIYYGPVDPPVLIGERSNVKDGDTIPEGPRGAVCHGVVHQVYTMSDGAINSFLDRMQAAPCA